MHDITVEIIRKYIFQNSEANGLQAKHRRQNASHASHALGATPADV